MPPSFEVERLPISGPRLEQRLRMLEEEDLASVERLRSHLFWERLKLDLDEKELVRRHEEFLATESNAIVREVAQSRMNTRTIVSAIRRKRLGLGPPEAAGEWVGHIRRNWSEPHFQLLARHPWIAPLERAMAAGDVAEADRIIISVPWTHFSRLAERYTFSFEAVVLYVARWDVLNRWTSRNEAAGRERIEQLVSEALGNHVGVD
jgi:hypothetical protein